MPSNSNSQRNISVPSCHYRGQRVGNISGCSGTPDVRTCLNKLVLSGLCTPNSRQRATDGPLKAKGHPRDGDHLTVFPFDQRALADGRSPWSEWILVCAVCPWRKPPPEAIQRIIDQRSRLDQQLGRYEAAETLQAREAIAAELGQADPSTDR